MKTNDRILREHLSLRPWFAWLGAFYLAWAALVLLGRHAGDLLDHGGIAAAMAAGSYVAGSTPMGGGTVGFPILVLLLGESAALGRDFSFAVQSIGMTSATFFILCRRRPVEWAMLRWAVLGSLLGTPLGIAFLAPHVPELFVKVLFAVVWASFGVLHLLRLRELARHEGLAPSAQRFDRNAGFLVGFLAGMTVSSITGVGSDMVIYCVLVLLCQADLRIAIPTSVILMATTSIIGVATKALTTGFQPGVYEHWLAAAPVVVLGAPLGAFVVERLGRVSTLYVVSVLCLGQFVWTVQQSWGALGPRGLLGALAGVAAFHAGFLGLHTLGVRLGRRGIDLVAAGADGVRIPKDAPG